MSEKNETDFRKLWRALADIEQVKAVVKHLGERAYDCCDNIEMANIKIELAKQLDCYNYDISHKTLAPVIAACPACAEAGFGDDPRIVCKRCPVDWKAPSAKDYQCEYEGALYFLWRYAMNLEDSCAFAAQIAELEWTHRKE